MLTILRALESPVIEALGWALVHFVWQAALLAGLLAGLLVPLRRASARVRYLVQCSTLVAMAACLPATWWWIASSEGANDVAAVSPDDRAAANEALRLKERPVLGPMVANSFETDEPILAAPAPLANDRELSPFSSQPDRMEKPSAGQVLSWNERVRRGVAPALPWLVGTWLLGVVALSLRLLVGWRIVQRLKRLAVTPAAAAWQLRLKDLATRLRISRPVKLVESGLIEVPTVIGWLRPAVLLPMSLLTNLTPQQLEAVLAHELAHIRRHDYLVNLIQTAIETLLFYHPVVWWLSRLIRNEREHCCDDLAVGLCDSPVTYVSALAVMEELRASPALAVAANGGSLLSRVRRIALGPATDSRRSIWWGASLIALTTLVALGLTTYLASHANDDPRSRPGQDVDFQQLAQGAVPLVSGTAAGESNAEPPPAAIKVPVSKPDDATPNEADRPGQIPSAMPPWGNVMNGLRARAIPVPSSMSEDAIDPAQRVTRFEQADDVAFAVELENVSDKPIKLLDTRYGEGYGESKGKANSDWLGQFLFSIDLFDRDGKKIERPEVQVIDLDMPLSGALLASLETGKTHRFLLRPAKWLSPLTQRMERGSYRAVVRYHGLPARVAARIKESRPNSSVLPAAEGNVVTPQVEFEVMPPASPVKAAEGNEDVKKAVDTGKPALVWGEPANGLRAAMEFMPRQATYSHGEKPDTKLHVQNVSDKPITLSSHLWLSDLGASVKNDKGEPVDVDSTWYSGWTLSSRVTLKPQQVVIYDAGNVGLAISKERAEKFEHVTHRTLVAPAGKYSMQLGGRFGDGGQLKDGVGKVLAPLEGDWVGELKTGAVPLMITNEIIECNIVDAVTGKPIAGTTTSFHFIKPKSASSEEEQVAVMVWGPKGPGRISFMIPDQVMQRTDREELEVKWGTGNHPDYENHSPAERIPLKQFFQDGTKAARETLSTIKLTPKKAGAKANGAAQAIKPLLEFRIAANEPEDGWEPVLPNDWEQRNYRDGRLPAGKDHDAGFAWYPLSQPWRSDAAFVISRSTEGTITEGNELLNLLSDQPKHVMLMDGSWSVLEAKVVQGKRNPAPGEERGYAINVRLDDAGAKRFAELVSSYRDMSLAVVMRGEIVGKLVLKEPSARLEFGGHFTKDWAEELVRQLNGQPPDPLATPVSFYANSVTLQTVFDKVLPALVERAGRKLSLDTDSFQAAGIEFNKFVTLRATDESLRRALDKILGASHVKLDYRLSDDGKDLIVFAPPGEKSVGASAPPKGLEFLTPYPKLHGLSLDMSEKQFLEIVKQQELKTRKIIAGGKATHYIGLGDGHTLIVMFSKNAKCSGIQRVRGEDAADEKPAAPVQQQESQKPNDDAKLPGRLFVNAGLRTTKDETRFSQSAIAIDPNTGSWTRLQNLSESGFTVPLSPVRVSPDGRTMLFMREKELWKCDAATGDRAERVLEKGSPAAWSPDGKTFMAVVEPNERDGQLVENWIVSADGQKQSVLVLPKGDAVEDWSADGQWLAVRSRLDSQIYLVKPDGSGRRRLADSVEYSLGHSSFSPDSRRIVYLSRQMLDDKSRFSLRTINLDGTGDRELLGEKKAGSEPDSVVWTAPMAARWSPDGKHLAVVLFDHTRDGGILAINGNWRLAFIDAGGGNLRELKLEGMLTTVLPWDGPEWRPVAPGWLPGAESPSPRPDAAAIDPNGEIVGRLVDAATGKPVEGATIACGAVINDSLKGGGTNTVTDAEGRYRLPVPSPGIYLVWLKKYDQDPAMTAAADDGLLVEAGKVVTSRLQLVKGRKVAGTVVDAAGKPFANLRVNCYSIARPHAGGGIESAKTKADGTFEFSLPPGRVHLYVYETVAKTKANPFGFGRYADSHFKASATDELAPITLTLQQQESKFGDPEWLNRSTPGTQIIRHENAADVTGTVVDVTGQPIPGAKVFRHDGPIITVDDKGAFKVSVDKGTQLVMHAFAPGHHVWFGAPTAGDVLKIVLEKKEAEPVAMREGVIETAADKVLEFSNGLLITTDADTKYARLTDQGEEAAERKELQPGVRVRYELAPGKGATKVVILAARQGDERQEGAPQEGAKEDLRSETRRGQETRAEQKQAEPQTEKPRGPWSVSGRVVDGDGKPMPGVLVTAHTGMGTLMLTGKAETNAEGRYEFRFGPGFLLAGNDTQVQVATISAHQPGYFEKNLSRQGDLLAALKLPEQEVGWGKKTKDDVILPDKPRQIDFVMLPAARLSGTLIDKDDKPLVGFGVSLTGDALPPSSSVIASVKTDEKGRFAIAGIPTGFKFQILVEPSKREPPWNAWASGTLDFRISNGDEFFIQQPNREVAANRFELQVIGEGVNWKEALKIGAAHQKLEPTGDYLTTESRLHAATIRLTLNPPANESKDDRAGRNRETNAVQNPNIAPFEWGKELNGLRTRVTLLTEKPAVGQPLRVKIELQNVGKVERTYQSQRADPDYLLDVVGPDGKPAEFIKGGSGIPVQTLKIKPDETVVLWEDVDVASMYLLPKSGRYEIKLRGPDKFDVDAAGPERAHPNPASNTLAVTLADGTLNDIQATFVRIRNIAPKDWNISTRGNSISNIQKSITRRGEFLLLFAKERQADDQKFGTMPYEYLGLTRLGHAYLAANPQAKTEWPEYVEKIREQLPPVDKATGEWGKELNGLRTRVTLLTEKPAVGQPLQVKIELQNAGQVERKYQSQRANPDYLLEIIGPDGKPAEFINGPLQVQVSSATIKAGETIVLWDAIDVASMFLLPKSGRYEIKLRGPDRVDGDEADPERVRLYPTSNTLSVTLAAGMLNEIQATFVGVRNIAPKDWQASTRDNSILLISPTFRKGGVGRGIIHLVFVQEQKTDEQKLLGTVQYEHLGLTALGHAYMAASPETKTEWPECVEKIRAQLPSKQVGSRQEIQKLQPVEGNKSGDGPDRSTMSDEALIALAIEAASKRYLTANVHSPWQIMCALSSAGPTMTLKLGDQRMHAVEWISNSNPQFGGEPWILKTKSGAEFHSFTRPWAFQGHPGQFLAWLTSCDLPLNHQFVTKDGTVTIQDMVNHLKQEVNGREQVIWVLRALNHYLPTDATWKNKDADDWSIERMVQLLVDEKVVGSADGGNPVLISLTLSRNKHVGTGQPLEGVWKNADTKIRTYVDKARELQNADGSMSTKFFGGPGHSNDITSILNGSGHTLEFLAVSLSDEQLKEPWVRKAYRRLAEDTLTIQQRQVDVAAFYHSLRALKLYRDRTSAQR